MKRLIAITITLVLALGLAACGGNSGATEPTSGMDATEATQNDDTAETQPSATPEDDTVQLSAAPEDETFQISTAPGNALEHNATPNPTLAGAINISTDKDDYSPGEDVLVTYTIQNIETFSEGIAIGIHDPLWGSHDPIYNWGASADEILVDSTEYLTAPDGAGNYEVRVYTVNGKTETGTEETLAAVIPFSVGEAINDATLALTASETTSNDGNFLFLSLGNLSPESEHHGINTQGLFDACIVFAGDTSETENLDISEFTVYIDDEAQPFTASTVTFAPGQYYETDNTTRYNIYFSETFSETDPPILFQPGKVWIEAVINGSVVRSQTLDWQEDGEQLVLDDASISQPLTLKATKHEPPLPDFTEEEFYAYHYINDDEIPNNGTPPTVPAPLENHRGDKAYFYVTSDDYIIRSFSGRAPISNVVSTSCELYNFIDGVCVNVCYKHVYDSVEDSFVGDRIANISLRDVDRKITHIDNVIYGEIENDTDDHYAIGMTKSELLKSLERSPGDIYDSMAQ